MRYLSDQNKLALLFESGTYGITSGGAGTGNWIGEVIDHSVTDEESILEDRFLGALTRSTSVYQGGPRNVNGTISYRPTDMRLLFWAIGSTNEFNGTGTAKIHYANQVNTNTWQSPFVSGTGQLNGPISFALEDSKTTAGSYFTRTIKGICLNNISLTATQGEKVTIDADYIAQNMAFSGGTSTLTVTIPTTTPYLWSNCTLTLSGNTANTAKDVKLTINQNLEGPHYLNGSRDIAAPILGNRENTLDVTLDLDDQVGNLLYSMYKNNAKFNSTFDLNADSTTGSQHTILFMSGCIIKSMEVPSEIEGVVESTVSIMTPTIIGSSIDTINYNPF